MRWILSTYGVHSLPEKRASSALISLIKKPNNFRMIEPCCCDLSQSLHSNYHSSRSETGQARLAPGVTFNPSPITKSQSSTQRQSHPREKQVGYVGFISRKSPHPLSLPSRGLDLVRCYNHGNDTQQSRVSRFHRVRESQTSHGTRGSHDTIHTAPLHSNRKLERL